MCISCQASCMFQGRCWLLLCVIGYPFFNNPFFSVICTLGSRHSVNYFVIPWFTHLSNQNHMESKCTDKGDFTVWIHWPVAVAWQRPHHPPYCCCSGQSNPECWVGGSAAVDGRRGGASTTAGSGYEQGGTWWWGQATEDGRHQATDGCRRELPG